MIQIITHRGLDPSKKPYFAESSLEAFKDQLARGYGLEFDLQPTRDGSFVVMHDASLKRISGGTDARKISELTLQEILSMRFDGCRLTSFANLLSSISRNQDKGQLSAIHLKHTVQKKAFLDLILSALAQIDSAKFIVFDVKASTAKYLKEHRPGLRLAPSVAHPYDIKRFNGVVGGTLLSVEEAIANRPLFDWVWLDEWDRKDENGKTKTLYNAEVFASLRAAGLKIAVVSPELHGSSPGLLGGEAHEDARTHQMLMNRLRDIIDLQPDAICTDYPDEVKARAVSQKASD